MQREIEEAIVIGEKDLKALRAELPQLASACKSFYQEFKKDLQKPQYKWSYAFHDEHRKLTSMKFRLEQLRQLHFWLQRITRELKANLGVALWLEKDGDDEAAARARARLEDNLKDYEVITCNSIL